MKGRLKNVFGFQTTFFAYNFWFAAHNQSVFPEKRQSE